MYINNLFQGVIAAWYDTLLSQNGLVVAFTRLRGFLIGVCSITRFPEHLLEVFLSLEGAWSDTFDFCYLWLLSCCPNWTT